MDKKLCADCERELEPDEQEEGLCYFCQLEKAEAEEMAEESEEE